MSAFRARWCLIVTINFFFYCPFASLKITRSCETESGTEKMDLKAIIHHVIELSLLRFASYSCSSSPWKRKILLYWVRCWFCAFLTRRTCCFPSSMLWVQGKAYREKEHQKTTWVDWQNICRCDTIWSLREKQIRDRGFLIVYISTFCPPGSY